MSRIPRFLEYLKTGFTAESVAAARYRAYAVRADRDGLPQLGERWRRLAAEKDALAIGLLEAAEQVRGGSTDVVAAIAEERYENDVLYPKMVRDIAVGGEAAAESLREVVRAQQGHLRELETLREELQAAEADVAAGR